MSPDFYSGGARSIRATTLLGYGVMVSAWGFGPQSRGSIPRGPTIYLALSYIGSTPDSDSGEIGSTPVRATYFP